VWAVDASTHHHGGRLVRDDIGLQVIHLVQLADRALGELAGLGRAMPNPNLLIRPFIRREAVLSSRIEGTQADLNDLYAYEAGQLALPGLKSAAPESDVREVLNYVRALEYGLERVNTLPVGLFGVFRMKASAEKARPRDMPDGSRKYSSRRR